MEFQINRTYFLKTCLTFTKDFILGKGIGLAIYIYFMPLQPPIHVALAGSPTTCDCTNPPPTLNITFPTSK